VNAGPDGFGKHEVLPLGFEKLNKAIQVDLGLQFS
jgi:hypothetical protein